MINNKGPPKVVTAEEAVSVIQSNTRVYVHGVAAVPRTLLSALSKRSHELRNVELCHIHLEAENPCSNFPESFFTNNFFVGANQRQHVAQGHSSYIPVFLSEVPKLMRKDIVRPNVALINVSPPDKHGFVSLGIETCASLPACETCDIIIAQINPHMPRTHGRSSIHINAIDYVVSWKFCLGLGLDDIRESVLKLNLRITHVYVGTKRCRSSPNRERSRSERGQYSYWAHYCRLSFRRRDFTNGYRRNPQCRFIVTSQS